MTVDFLTELLNPETMITKNNGIMLNTKDHPNNRMVLCQIKKAEINMKNRNVDVIIPTYRPGKEFTELLTRLERQESSGQNCSHEYRRAVLEPGMGEV